MTDIEKDLATFVVSEQGGGWPARLGGHGRHVVALPQDTGELLAGLVSRVTSTLARLTKCGIEVGRAYLVCNQRMDDAAVVARVMMAMAMLGAMREARGGGRLVLAGDPSRGPALRLHLLGLTETLTREMCDRNIEITSSFGVLAALPREVRRRAGAAQLLH